MSVILRNIQIPLFIKVQTGCLAHIRKILDEHHLYFQKPLILSHAHILELGGNEALTGFINPATILIEDNSMAEANRIAQEAKDKKNDLIISIGGGRVLDVGKYVATKARLNYISIPTSPSNDGICSPVAVLKNEQGVTESLPVNMPVGVLVDSTLLKTVPQENILAGVGDLISNFSAIADWQLAYEAQKEKMDDFAASIALSAAQLIYEMCREKTVDIQSKDFLEKLIHGLILSGIAMNIAGSSRPCSGSEHKISHAIDLLYPGSSLHGLQVAFSTLLAGVMRNEDISPLVRWYKQIGLPVLAKEIRIDDEQLVNALLHASDTRPERFTILEKNPLTRVSAQALINQYHAISK